MCIHTLKCAIYTKVKTVNFQAQWTKIRLKSVAENKKKKDNFPFEKHILD